MSKAPKLKTRAGAPAPQNREEAASFIRRIGENNRAIARAEADMNDAIVKLKEAAEATAAPLADETKQLAANRALLTDNGKRKHAELGTGRIEWRLAPPKVTIKGADAVLHAIKTLGLPFVRIKEEIDKEAMLAEPEKARLVPGVSIGSGGETFSVEPFEAELTGGAS